MARICDICGKKPATGKNVSHAHNKSLRRFMPNLQNVRALTEGRVRHLTVCTRCIRSGRVQKVPPGYSGSRAGQAAAGGK